MLQLGFINILIVTIGLISFNILNVMHLCKSVRDVVYLKCRSKWAANE